MVLVNMLKKGCLKRKAFKRGEKYSIKVDKNDRKIMEYDQHLM
jgi:hypothetical protein